MPPPPRPPRSFLRLLAVYVLPLCIPWLIVYGLVATAPGVPLVRTAVPTEQHHDDQCNWHCHNAGCPHRPHLPTALSGPGGLVDDTIRTFKRIGRTLSPHNPRAGYGLANIAFFCVLWPGLMYALWVRVWHLRDEIARLESTPRSQS